MENYEAVAELTMRKAVVEEDTLFLQRLYVESRSHGLAPAGWQDEEVVSFLRSQYELRNMAYQLRYPGAECRVIEIGGVPVGAIIVSLGRDGIRLIDLSVLTKDRGQGFGSAAIEKLKSEARQASVSVVLHVDKSNLVGQRLYQKLGFHPTNEDQISIEMRWP